MPIYRLAHDSLAFPDPRRASDDGLLAVGGDLSLARILAAYSNGIFPWYSADNPILWWSPNPRCVLFPQEFHMPRSLARTLRKNTFTITCNQNFAEVITACAAPRTWALLSAKDAMDEEGTSCYAGTWLTPEMIEAYIGLHHAGFAHSVEAWQDGMLVGGIYGLALGRAFFGESMFYTCPDASKAALAYLVQRAQTAAIHFIDCQQETDNLLRFGARPISRDSFLTRLHTALAIETPPWLETPCQSRT